TTLHRYHLLRRAVNICCCLSHPRKYYKAHISSWLRRGVSLATMHAAVCHCTALPQSTEHRPGAMVGDHRTKSNAAGRTAKTTARGSEVPNASYSACLRDAH